MNIFINPYTANLDRVQREAWGVWAISPAECDMRREMYLRKHDEPSRWLRFRAWLTQLIP